MTATGPRLLRGSGMAQQVIPAESWKPYRYGGRPGWDPSALGPMGPGETDRQAARSARAARMAGFARHRRAGLTIGAAAARAGVSYSAGRAYERELRQAGQAGT
jgi:hypothetical protein